MIATYNRLAYLERALASVLSQDLQDFDVHVVDDASTDGTGAYLDGLRDSRLRVFHQPTNLGWLANCNAALATVRTEYTAMLGDDDVMTEGALRRAVSVLDARPSVGLVHSAVALIDAGGTVVADRVAWTRTAVEDVVERGQLFIARCIRAGCRVCAATAVARTAALPPVPFDPLDGPTADLGLWLRIALRWDVAFLATPSACYRVHAGSDSASWGTATPHRYVETQALIRALRATKLRFVAGHHHELERPWRLRASALVSGRASSAALRASGDRGSAWLERRRPQLGPSDDERPLTAGAGG